MSELIPGDVLGGCRVEAVIGRGGMGVVYRALQLDLRRPVALKVIAADRAGDAEFRGRFERESLMAAAIDHPNIVPVYAAGEEQGALFLVMRFVPGSDLHAVIRSDHRLAPERAAAIVAQIGSALDAAHAAGLVHRDVKPANVLLSAAEDHAYLSDFGLTRRIDPQHPITDSGQWLGTVDFASPEQLGGGSVDARSDVYSLGCVLHAALTGSAPFPRGTVPATLLAHLHDAPPRPSAAGAPAHFDRVVARALAKDPADRYPSAGDLGRAALAAARGEAVTESERTVAIGPAAPRPSPRRLTPQPPEPEPKPKPRRTAATARARKPSRARRRRWPFAAALLIPLAGIATVAALMLAGDGGNDAAAARTAPLAGGEVRAAAEAFAQAYETEDAEALRRLLTADVQRVLPDGVARGRGEVVRQYATQFRDNATRSYDLEDLTVRGGRAGRASGEYRVRRAGGESIGGRIVLGVVRDRGRTLIALIAVTPRV
ncbi:MAG TPA: serine/threonine-protein kinase [Solirubrobacteraceae bacterium]|nr:serine/threonine-protein kinase [Solirubrobacteraceae bacterium]